VSEVAPFGIRTMLIDPGFFRTEHERQEGRRPRDGCPGRAISPAVGASDTVAAMPLFSLDEAVAETRLLLPVLDEIVALRADAAEIAAASAPGGRATSLGSLPELKAAQARLDELLTRVQETGAELKGLAPLLVDFPSELDGEDVLLCWLEGDRELSWYHRVDLGFAGRRPLP